MDDYLALMASATILATAWRILVRSRYSVRFVSVWPRGKSVTLKPGYIVNLNTPPVMLTGMLVQSIRWDRVVMARSYGYEVNVTLKTAPVIAVVRNSLCQPVYDPQLWMKRMYDEGRIHRVQE